MACKYKKFHTSCTKPYCEVSDGECQFVIDAKDSVCSIRAAYHGEELLTSTKAPTMVKTLTSKIKKLFKK